MQDEYVVWNGHEIHPYTKPSCVDCMVSVDGKLISVQGIRTWLIGQGLAPVIIFSCEAGQSALEDVFNGRCSGVFTHYWLEITRDFPDAYLRELLVRVNDAMANNQYDQAAEVLCLKSALDRPLDEVMRVPFVLLSFDMCRKRL